MASLFSQASHVLNDIITGKEIDAVAEVTYSTPLQRLYIRYVKLTSSVNETTILGPRAFFIYLIQGKTRLYTSDTLEGKIKELVRDIHILDTHPTGLSGGKHLNALRIFCRS